MAVVREWRALRLMEETPIVKREFCFRDTYLTFPLLNLLIRLVGIIIIQTSWVVVLAEMTCQSI